MNENYKMQGSEEKHVTKESHKRICANCGSESYYAKGLCRNCYSRFLRSTYAKTEDFVQFEKGKSEIIEERLKIKAITSVIKFNYAEIARRCGVSRELVRQWFSHTYIPDKYIKDIYEYIKAQADEAYNILVDHR